MKFESNERNACGHKHTRTHETPTSSYKKYHRVNTTSMRDFARTIIFILYASLIRSLAQTCQFFMCAILIIKDREKKQISLCVLLQPMLMMMRWFLFISSVCFCFDFGRICIFIFCTRVSWRASTSLSVSPIYHSFVLLFLSVFVCCYSYFGDCRFFSYITLYSLLFSYKQTDFPVCMNQLERQIKRSGFIGVCVCLYLGEYCLLFHELCCYRFSSEKQWAKQNP